MDKSEFIEESKKIYGNKYDYSKVVFIDKYTKVCIICPKHGEFWQIPYSHLKGYECRKCGAEKAGNSNRSTLTEFIEKAKKVHGDEYDYSKVNYVDAHTKVCIICPKHGEFWQKPIGHLNGYGCPKCGLKKISKKNSLTTQVFIERAKKIHGYKYDYSKVKYKNENAKVCIICPKHGEFWQTPYSHLVNNGCPLCSREKLGNDRRMSTKEFIEKSKLKHGDRYDYSKANYTGYYNKVCIICPEHGEFWQIAYDHMQGKGCPKCRKSKLEIEMSEFLDKNKIKYEEQKRPKCLSVGKSHLSVDFYLTDYNAAIECQGLQHFEDGTFFGKRKESIKERDKRKLKLANENGLKIFYYSNFKIENYIGKVYNDKKELLNDIIKNEKKLL